MAKFSYELNSNYQLTKHYNNMAIYHDIRVIENVNYSIERKVILNMWYFSLLSCKHFFQHEKIAEN